MGLDRIFHEPGRLAIVSELCASEDGISFNQLKTDCQLTFGNTSSHLKVLHEAEIVDIKKSFVDNKPRTTIYITETGRERFIRYLGSLEQVFKKAADSVNQDEMPTVHSSLKLNPGHA